jgi:hypothetical protein
MAALIPAFLFFSAIDLYFIQPGKYWLGGDCLVCGLLFRVGQWIPFSVGLFTALLLTSRGVISFGQIYAVVIFEFIFEVAFSLGYASQYLYGIAWVGDISEAAYVAAFWVFWNTVGLVLGYLSKLTIKRARLVL